MTSADDELAARLGIARMCRPGRDCAQTRGAPDGPALYAPGRPRQEPRVGSSAAERLEAGGYRILPVRFTSPGVLFRALGAGAAAALRAGTFSDSGDARSMPAQERRLEVHFLSHELSDALTMARPWTRGAIGVLDVALFHRARACGEAGVLAFAEGGQVFRYPFVARAPALEDCLALVSSRPVRDAIDARTRASGPRRVEPDLDRLPADMACAERTLIRSLDHMGLEPARIAPVPGDRED